MGYQDRDYYRDDSRGGGLFGGASPACKALVLINVAVFVAQVVFPDAGLEQAFAAHADEIFGKGRVWQLLTAAFLHDPSRPFHIIVNMLFLWMAGRELESEHGSREFVAFYLIGAVVSTLAWAVLAAFSPGGQTGAVMLGASGAVTAAVTLYTLQYPRREVLFLFVLPMPMWLVLLIFLGCDFVYLMNQTNGRGAAMGVAFAAHLGGAGYAYLYKTAGLRWTRLLRGSPRRRKPKLRVVQPDLFDREVDTPAPSGSGRSMASSSPSRPSPNVVASDEQFESRVDEVLSKLGREGREGLTEDEKRLLDEASRRARARRSDRVR